MCRRHTHLTSQLEAVLVEGEGLRAEVEVLKKENKALVLETQDLSRQVALLLKEANDSSLPESSSILAGRRNSHLVSQLC